MVCGRRTVGFVKTDTSYFRRFSCSASRRPIPAQTMHSDDVADKRTPLNCKLADVDHTADGQTASPFSDKLTAIRAPTQASASHAIGTTLLVRYDVRGGRTTYVPTRARRRRRVGTICHMLGWDHLEKVKPTDQSSASPLSTLTATHRCLFLAVSRILIMKLALF